MINNMNDLELCDSMALLSSNFDLLNHLWAEGGNAAMKHSLSQIIKGAEEAKKRIEEIEKESP